MALTITGMQQSGVQAVAKHYIGNEQETQRNPTLPTESDPVEILAYSANIGDRAMHELYLQPFAESVRAGVASVMCSYNRVNGTYACEVRLLFLCYTMIEILVNSDNSTFFTYLYKHFTNKGSEL